MAPPHAMGQGAAMHAVSQSPQAHAPVGAAPGAQPAGAQPQGAQPQVAGGGTFASAIADTSARQLLGFLVSFDNNNTGQSWPLFRGTNLLGRAGAAASAAIELPHATVSSRHATLHVNLVTAPGSVPQAPGMPSVRAARVFLVDHSSTNGSYVNDATLAPDQQCELQDGDRVRLGLFNLIVKII
ncbi:MAG TPA: FHA domain-containing protein [Polyangiaceae bacterium]|nr:FHA domain-containing protein [Polyangiaceae bacterium]